MSYWRTEGPQSLPHLISNRPGDFRKTQTVSPGLPFVLSTTGHTLSACCAGWEPG